MDFVRYFECVLRKISACAYKTIIKKVQNINFVSLLCECLVFTKNDYIWGVKSKHDPQKVLNLSRESLEKAQKIYNWWTKTLALS